MINKTSSTRSYDDYFLVDKNPGSKSSHVVELQRGFVTASRCIVEAVENGEYHVSHLETKDAYRGKGLSKQLISYIEKEYGPVRIESANDSYWLHAGYEANEDGCWRRKV